MKLKLFVFVVFLFVILSGCGTKPSTETAKPSSTTSPATASATPVPTSTTPKNGDYDGKGVVTKINLELGSVELDHEEVKGVMPAMKMEFYVTDKKMLDGLKVGDKVDFVLRYKDYTETIAGIKKSK